MKKHIRCFHSEKIFQCPNCEKAFCRPDKLRLHMLRHSDRKDFLCSTCGKQFKVSCIHWEVLFEKQPLSDTCAFFEWVISFSSWFRRGRISCGSICSECTILTERLRRRIETTAPKASNGRCLPPTLRALCSNADSAWWDSDAEECWWVKS